MAPGIRAGSLGVEAPVRDFVVQVGAPGVVLGQPDQALPTANIDTTVTHGDPVQTIAVKHRSGKSASEFALALEFPRKRLYGLVGLLQRAGQGRRHRFPRRLGMISGEKRPNGAGCGHGAIGHPPHAVGNDNKEAGVRQERRPGGIRKPERVLLFLAASNRSRITRSESHACSKVIRISVLPIVRKSRSSTRQRFTTGTPFIMVGLLLSRSRIMTRRLARYNSQCRSPTRGSSARTSAQLAARPMAARSTRRS